MGKFNYFELDEFVRSETAAARGINNTPTFEVVDHLEELVYRLLDPLRDAWGGPIRVTSGYRCEALNRAVGGAVTSVHKIGYAADLYPADGRIAEFISFLPKWCLENGVKWDQIIDERSTNGSRWCHVGLKANNGAQRGQILKMTVK